MLSEAVDEALRQFGAWDRVGNPVDKMWYPSSDPTARLRGIKSSGMLISDDEAMWLNPCLCDLKVSYPFEFQVMYEFYGHNKSLNWQHHNGRGDRKALASALRFAKGYVEGYLKCHIAA